MKGKLKIDYIVKPQNDVVVCIIKGNGVSCSGVARCHPDDTFDEELGKEVARRKAIIKYKKLILADIRNTLDYIKSEKTRWIERENLFIKKSNHVKESIGELYTEIDNIVEFYSK